MSPEEARHILSMVAGYWPRPELSDSETDAWNLELLPREYELGVAVVRALANSGREFRPGAGRFASEYEARRRLDEMSAESVPAIEGPAMSPKLGVAMLREALANAEKGPLTEEFADVVADVEDSCQS